MLRSALLFAWHRVARFKKATPQSERVLGTKSRCKSLFSAPRKQNNIPGAPRKLGFPSIRNLTSHPQSPASPAAEANSPITVYSNVPDANPDQWTPRPSFERDIIRIATTNLTAFLESKDMRQNAYRGIMIPGGIGVGKTRAAAQIPHIIANFINTTTTPTRDAKEKLGGIVYTRLDFRRLQNLPAFDSHAKDSPRPPATDNDDEIAAWLLENFCQEIWPKKEGTVSSSARSSVDDLIDAISLARGSNQRKPMFICLHLDEMQMQPNFCLALARFVANYNTQKFVENRKALLMLILTGLGGVDSYDQAYGASAYKLESLQLQLSTDPTWLNEIADQFIFNKFTESRRNIILAFRKEHPQVYTALLSTTGGIPEFMKLLLVSLSAVEVTNASPAAIAQAAFNSTLVELKGQYSAKSNASWFSSPEHVRLLIRKAYFKERVTREDLLGKLSIGKLEESGLIYLVPEGDQNELTIGLPLLMLHHLDSAMRVQVMTGLQRLNDPFSTLNEIQFEEFIAEIYQFTWRLLRGRKSVTLAHLHRSLLQGSDSLLQTKIPLSSSMAINEMEALRDQELQPHHFKVAGNKAVFSMTDANNNFILRTRKRYSGADIVIPGRFQVQLKWSLYVADMRPIRQRNDNTEDGTVCLSANKVKTEHKKSCPALPLVIITPKSLEKGLLDEIPRKVGIIGADACAKFMAPFYLYPILRTEVNQPSPQ